MTRYEKDMLRRVLRCVVNGHYWVNDTHGVYCWECMHRHNYDANGWATIRNLIGYIRPISFAEKRRIHKQHPRCDMRSIFWFVKRKLQKVKYSK